VNTNPTTVYGGGKVNISIPPCDGSANFGRRGYCVWGPQGIDTNYVRPSKNVVQEWEMNDDLGDRHNNSLQQGGKLPSNSLECRVVGRIYAKQGESVQIEWYPSAPTLGLTLSILDKNCVPIDSLTQVGNGTFSFTPTYSGWHTIRLRNATATQAGQHCWVKAIYEAPAVVATNEVKNKCACAYTDPNASLEQVNFNLEIALYPNPNCGHFEIMVPQDFSIEKLDITDIHSKLVEFKYEKKAPTTLFFDLENATEGLYWLTLHTNLGTVVKMIQVLD